MESEPVTSPLPETANTASVVVAGASSRTEKWLKHQNSHYNPKLEP